MRGKLGRYPKLQTRYTVVRHKPYAEPSTFALKLLRSNSWASSLLRPVWGDSFKEAVSFCGSVVGALHVKF